MRLDFTRPDASEYLAVLDALLTFHTAVTEFSRETVTNTLGTGVDLLTRTHALRADIASMRERVPCAAGGPRRDAPVLATGLRGGRDEKVGAAYVAAGSVLGGRVIVANLAASSGADFPRSFFASENLDLGRLWRRFRTALDVFGESGANPDRVVAGALAAFALIRDLLDGPSTTPGAAR